jgi:hypothetical protein
MTHLALRLTARSEARNTSTPPFRDMHAHLPSTQFFSMSYSPCMRAHLVSLGTIYSPFDENLFLLDKGAS